MLGLDENLEHDEYILTVLYCLFMPLTQQLIFLFSCKLDLISDIDRLTPISLVVFQFIFTKGDVGNNSVILISHPAQLSYTVYIKNKYVKQRGLPDQKGDNRKTVLCLVTAEVQSELQTEE